MNFHGRSIFRDYGASVAVLNKQVLLAVTEHQLFPFYVARALQKRQWCMSDSSKVVCFWRIRLAFSIESEELMQHRFK